MHIKRAGGPASHLRHAHGLAPSQFDVRRWAARSRKLSELDVGRWTLMLWRPQLILSAKRRGIGFQAMPSDFHLLSLNTQLKTINFFPGQWKRR